MLLTVVKGYFLNLAFYRILHHPFLLPISNKLCELHKSGMPISIVPQFPCYVTIGNKFF